MPNSQTPFCSILVPKQTQRRAEPNKRAVIQPSLKLLLKQGTKVLVLRTVPFTLLCPQLTLCIEELSVFVEVCQEQAIHQRGFAQA